MQKCILDIEVYFSHVNNPGKGGRFYYVRPPRDPGWSGSSAILNMQFFEWF